MSNGIFVISLDFELQYGVEDHSEDYIAKYKKNLMGARTAIPEILERFRDNRIHATWATVGMLIPENRDNLVSAMPERKPSYTNANLSVYSHMDRVGEDEDEDPFHYGSSLVKQIHSIDGQEIGSHTFSHYYTQEAGQSKAEFREDIKASSQVIKSITGERPISIVFPRNQINKDHRDILKSEGMFVYRGCAKGFSYDNPIADSLLTRAIRLIDSYVGICLKKTYPISDVEENDGLYNVRASAFLRPYSKTFCFLESIKVMQIKHCMTRAAKKNEIYHLWWHPHNFGTYKRENLRNLDRIIAHYMTLKTQYGMRSLNMGEIGRILSADNI